MELEGQKIRVADWLWGKSDPYGRYHYTSKSGMNIVVTLKEWNPQDNVTGRKWWDEIWENMDNKLFDKYLLELSRLMNLTVASYINHPKLFHTAKPDICWKALIIALRYIYGT